MTAFLKARYVLKNVGPEGQSRTNIERLARDPEYQTLMRNTKLRPKPAMPAMGEINPLPRHFNYPDPPAHRTPPPELNRPNAVHHYNEEGDFHDDDLYVEQLMEQLAYQQDQERQQKLREGVEMANPGNVSPYRYPRGAYR